MTENHTLSEDLRAQLTAIDTPTVCNALERVVPERRGYGYTVSPLVCTRPELPPIVGFALCPNHIPQLFLLNDQTRPQNHGFAGKLDRR